MKVITTTTTELSDHDFNVLTKKIANAIYDIEPEIADVYEIYINIVNDEWVVNFSPKSATVPVLKVDTYTVYDPHNREHLEIQPIKLEKFPNVLNISTYDKCMDVSEFLVTLSNFVIGLSDFSYILS